MGDQGVTESHRDGPAMILGTRRLLERVVWTSSKATATSHRDRSPAAHGGVMIAHGHPSRTTVTVWPDSIERCTSAQRSTTTDSSISTPVSVAIAVRTADAASARTTASV